MQTLAIDLPIPPPTAAGRHPATDEATAAPSGSFGDVLARARMHASDPDDPAVAAVPGLVMPRIEGTVPGSGRDSEGGDAADRATSAISLSATLVPPTQNTTARHAADTAPSGATGTVSLPEGADAVSDATTSANLATNGQRAPLPATLTQTTSSVQVTLANTIGLPVTTTGNAPTPTGTEGPTQLPASKTAEATARPGGKFLEGATAARTDSASADAQQIANSTGTGAAKPDAATPAIPSATASAPMIGAAADGTLALAGGTSPDDGTFAPGFAGERADAATRIGAQLAAARTPPSPPPLPGEQVSVHILNAVRSGADRIHIRLHPAELGRVEIKLDIGHDRAVTAIVTTEKPETADLLSRDARILQRALEDAGLRADTGSLSFRHGGDSTGAGAQRNPPAPAHLPVAGATGASSDGQTTAPAAARTRHDGLVDLDA